MDALALTQIVVGLAADDLFGETRHCVGSYVYPIPRGVKYQRNVAFARVAIDIMRLFYI